MQIVGSFMPNSAAAERVFSMLKRMFGDMQMRALVDMIQAALMLNYNGRRWAERRTEDDKKESRNERRKRR